MAGARGNAGIDAFKTLRPGDQPFYWLTSLMTAQGAWMNSIRLAERKLDYSDIAQHLKAMRAVGTPYSDEMIANARADLLAQVSPDADPTALEKRYPRVVVGKFNGQAEGITEMDALVAYLQMLGTLVRFGDLPPERLRQ